MSTYFVRPGHLHTVARISSCSEESGLIASPAVSDSANGGALRLRVTGNPTAETRLDVKLQTGGNPTGYAVPNVDGRAPGSAMIWKTRAAASNRWMGYVDTPFLTSVRFPIGWDNDHRYPSTPRVLADGYLGVLVGHAGDIEWRLYRIDTDGVSTGASSGSIPGTGTWIRADFAVLPSGRLIAVVDTSATTVSFASYISDDHGVTWSLLGETHAGNDGSGSWDVLCLEVVEDVLVLLQADSAGVVRTRSFLSTDGGATFSLVGEARTLVNPRTTVQGGRVLVTSQAAIGSYVYELIPGGDISSTNVSSNAACQGDHHCIATREDGSIWVVAAEATGVGDLALSMGASIDGGLSFEDPCDGDNPCDLGVPGYATSGFIGLGACFWQGGLVVLGRIASSTGSDNSLAFLHFGGWATVTDPRGDAVYKHSYLPVDYPSALGWTHTTVGGGGTVTNQNHLRLVETGATNDNYRSSATIWNTAAGDSRKIRFRFRVISGGSVTTTASRLRFVITDGVNQQEVVIRFSTTAMRAYDGAGTIIGAEESLDLTGWCELLLAFGHDTPTAGAGQLSTWYKLDSATNWIPWHAASNVPEVVGIEERIEFGGNTGGPVTWDIAYLGIADLLTGMEGGTTNPDDLSGFSVAAAGDVSVKSGIRIGGRNGGGVPGDTYTVDTTYSYGKENIWREFRPSKQLRSAADNQVWSVTFDASSTDAFKGNLVALFGTNFRTATLQMNATDSWGAPSVSTALDATVTSFTIGAGVRGPGYVGPTTALDWRPGQYRSDGDAHRWFISISGTVYEIADNDEARIFVDGVDLSAASGTAYIFGDRMAATQTFAQYRFARILVPSLDTKDGHYRLGTMILDKRFEPAQTYDHGFVDRIEPAAVLTTGDAGYRASVRKGPRRHTFALQWSPIDRMGSVSADTELRLRNFYAAIEGSHRPIVFWPDSTDQGTLLLCRVVGVYSGSNVWGEGSTAVTRVDQLVLEEEI